MSCLLRSLRLYVVVLCSFVLLCLVGLTGCGWRVIPYQPDFALSATPATSSVAAGTAGTTYQLTVTPGQFFTTDVTIVATVPQGFSCLPASCSVLAHVGAAAPTMQVTPGATVAVGTYTMSFTGTSVPVAYSSAQPTHTVTTQMTVSAFVPPADFSLAVTPKMISVAAGATVPAYSVSVTPINGFAAPVTVTMTAPAGFGCVQAGCNVTLPTGTTSAVNALQLTTTAATVSGTYPVTFTATSGGLSHSVAGSITITPPTPVGDFALTASEVQLTGTNSGSAFVEAYTLNIVPINGFNAPVTVTVTLPAGLTCVSAPCVVTFPAGTTSLPNSVMVGIPNGTPAGPYVVTFTGVSGSLQHVARDTINVEPLAPPLGTNACTTVVTDGGTDACRSGFVYTGAPQSLTTDYIDGGNIPLIVYDAAHNHVLASNFSFNSIDVIDPESLTLVTRVPVLNPAGLDLSLDGKTLVIGTMDADYFYTMDLATLRINGSVLVSQPQLNAPTPVIPHVLADGSILFVTAARVLGDPYVPGQQLTNRDEEDVVLWSASAGWKTLRTNSGTTSYHSGDRQHVFFRDVITPSNLVRYDVATGTMQVMTIPSAETYLQLAAVNADGSRLVFFSGGQMLETDGNLQTLAKYAGTTPGSIALFSPDYTKLYSSVTPNSFAFDGTSLQYLGLLPDLSVSGASIHGSPVNETFDGAGRIVRADNGGVSFLPSVVASTLYAAHLENRGESTLPSYPAIPTATSPTPALPGRDFAGTPSVVFREGSVAKVGTSATLISGGSLQVQAPVFDSGCADVEAYFTNALPAYQPMYYCYKPTVYVTDGAVAPTTGGTTMILSGLGLLTSSGQAPKVTVGGASATVALSADTVTPFLFTQLLVTVPPGTAGTADVTISNDLGSTTLPGALTYVAQTNIPLASGSEPAQMIVDIPHNHILVTDTVGNRIEVFSLDAKQLLQTLPTGPAPMGITLTADGTRIVYVTHGDRMVTVLDATTLTMLHQMTLPVTVPAPFTGKVGAPHWIVAPQGNQVFIWTDPDLVGSFGSVFAYNLATNDVTWPFSTAQGGNLYGDGDLVVSADGLTVRFGMEMIFVSPSGTTTLEPAPYFAADGETLAINGDGTSMLSNRAIYDRGLRLRGYLNADPVVVERLNNNQTYGEPQLNLAGSLGYVPTEQGLDIYDMGRGLLKTRLPLAPYYINMGNYLTFGKLLALDPAGQRAWLITGGVALNSTGAPVLTEIQFQRDPFSIGEVQVNGSILNILGSGILSGSTLTIDGTPVSASVMSSILMTASSSGLSSGVHTVTVAGPDGQSYTLQNAFTTQ